jgi:hypothetical protein
MAPGAPDAAAFHANRGACFLHLRQYADVVVEATRVGLKPNQAPFKPRVNWTAFILPR